MLLVTAEAVRVSRGLVLWVCAGVTRKHCYQPGPEGLLWEWWRRGGRCRRPAYWHRDGIPGSGGKQWLRANVEYVLAFTGCKKTIPWADNTANGHPPKWAPGGEMSYRDAEGNRRNDANPWGKRSRGNNFGGRNVDGSKKLRTKKTYVPPVLANPGCLIKGIKVGGGLLGHALAHKNEAPFPQKLAEWFVRSWCPPGGRVLDPFSGSGTTVAAANVLGRHGVGLDLRMSQCLLGRERCKDLQPNLFQ